MTELIFHCKKVRESGGICIVQCPACALIQEQQKHTYSTPITLENTKHEIGFSCKICTAFQVVYFTTGIFPICDKCLADLKEIISKNTIYGK